MTNYRHYLATCPPHISLEWLRSHKQIPEIILTRIQNCINTTNSEAEFNRFKLLDLLEQGQPPLVVVIPSRNNEEYVKKNLQSVAIQKYPNYRIIYLDDQSDDRTVELVKYYAKSYNLVNYLKLVVMPERNRQGASRFRAYHMCDDDEILCMLDGDDWLYDENALNKVALQYQRGAMVTYGSYIRYANGTLEGFVYGKDENFDHQVIKQRGIRQHRWITQHLRTGYAGLFKRISYQDLVDRDNKFLKVATDVCETMPILEMAYPNVAKISTPTYVYNVDASNRHKTSYFRVGEFPEQRKIRDAAMLKIKKTKPYGKVSKAELIRSRTLYPSFQIGTEGNNSDYLVIGDPENTKLGKYTIEYLVKLLDACQLPLLVVGVPLVQPTYVFSKDISIGYYYQSSKLDFCIISRDLYHRVDLNHLEYTGLRLNLNTR